MYGKIPFISDDPAALKRRCYEVTKIQTAALVRRLSYVNPKKVVLNISGGLDSTLALLIVISAMRKLNRLPGDIIALNLPGPGTTGRTKNNAVGLVNALGCTLKVIDITDAVMSHLKQIGHNGQPDVTFENAQARERTQIGMDIANMSGGIFIGTPDLSEIALGFATFGGDHLSMYGVNSGVPKTLIRYLINYFAQENENIKDILLDIIATPISPELLPVKEGPQHTEKILGNYELHDFILFYFVRYGYKKEKIRRLLYDAFRDDYDGALIDNALDVFYKRFFANQYKRNCAPEGAIVGSVSLTGEWDMPGDVGYYE